MLYVWLWLIAQLLLLLPNHWTVSLYCRDGSMLSAHENACVYFALPASFFRPFKVYTNFTAEVYSYYYTVNDGSPVPISHGPAATLAYVNRELINTLVSLVSPRGPYGREEEHAMRYYSGGLGQRLLAILSALGWTWLLGYNASIIARRPRVSTISPPKFDPPRPEALVIATPCDLEFSRPGMSVRSSLEKTFALHI